MNFQEILLSQIRMCIFFQLQKTFLIDQYECFMLIK